MKAITAMLVGLLASGAALQGPEKPMRAPLFDEKAEAQTLIDAALARARRDNRRVIVQWGANWCRWCKLLQELFTTDPKVRRQILYEYEIVRIDVGRFDKNLDLAARYGVDFARGIGIPYLTFLDAEGLVLANEPTAALEIQEHGKEGHDPAKVSDLLARHQAPYPLADALLAEALAAAKVEDKLVLLFFGAPGSGPAARFEAWTASAEIAPRLGKDLLAQKVDVARTIGGRELMHGMRKDGAQSLPWFAILDAQGSPIATSEAGAEPKNVQFPAEPAAIEHFKAMLGKVARRITEADIDQMARSLADLREAEQRAAAEKAKAEQGGG